MDRNYRRKLAFAGWGLLACLAISTGAGALRYALPNVPYPAPLPNFHARHNWLIAHATLASIALLAGPWQFLSGLRQRSLTLHRWLGRIYCATVLGGWIASVPIAAHAQTGAIASAGFLALGAAWIVTTATAWFTIRNGDVICHREWMVRSYALTAAAITLRLYLPILLLSGVPFAASYPIVAWLCWVPNLLFAESLLPSRKPKSFTFVSSYQESSRDTG